MSQRPRSLLFLLLLLLCTLTTSCTPSPDHLLKSTTSSHQNTASQPFEVTLPVPRDHRVPDCSLLLFQHNFSNTIGSPPFNTTYSPPSNCPYPWSSVYIELNASCIGEQYDRIAGVWINGIELLRTSTAQPTEAGVFWNVRKDVTRYVSALKQSNSTVSMMLENAVDDVFTGIYHVTLSLNFYKKSGVRVSWEEEEGSDLKSGGKLGFWNEENVELGLLSEKREKGILGKESSSGGREERLAFLSEKPLEEGKFELLSGETGGRVRNLGMVQEENVEKSGVLEREGNVQKMGDLGFLAKEEKPRFDFPSKESFHLIGRRGKLGHPLEKLPAVANDQDDLLKVQQEKCAGMKTQEVLGGLYKEPADLIIPISDDGEKGSWFRIQNESDVRWKEIEIPANTYRAVLEIYVSFHGNDEFWYTNPPTKYIQLNNLTTGRGNGAFRQVFVMIDKLNVGSVMPFPVVYTGGINPLFWEPSVAIGAFDLPSYDLNLTPFLGHLLDGKPHAVGLGVMYGLPFWLVNANLHLWLDDRSQKVEAKFVKYRWPNISIEREFDFEALNGRFKIVAKRRVEFSGWVRSSAGNLTTYIAHELKFKNEIDFEEDGNFKEVKQKVKVESEVKVETYPMSLFARATYKNKYPLNIKTLMVPKENNTYLSKTMLAQRRKEDSSVVLANVTYYSSLDNSLESEGRMLVQNHSVLSGRAITEQDYDYKDNKGCYFRILAVKDGEVREDRSSEVCSVRP